MNPQITAGLASLPWTALEPHTSCLKSLWEKSSKPLCLDSLSITGKLLGQLMHQLTESVVQPIKELCPGELLWVSAHPAE